MDGGPDVLPNDEGHPVLHGAAELPSVGLLDLQVGGI